MKTQLITEHLVKLGTLYFNSNDISRASTFNTAATNIELSYPIELPEDISILKSIKGIGPSTINEIEEFIKTGTSSRLLKLLETNKEVSIDNLSSIDKLKSLLSKNDNK